MSRMGAVTTAGVGPGRCHTCRVLAPIDTVLDRYLAAQLGGRQQDALSVLERALADGYTVRALQRDVVQAAQRELGRLWGENRISVADEHMATAIAQRALVHLYERAAPVWPRGPIILLACVEGEQHEFPARLVADYLELGGYAVRYLGASVPTSSLCAAIARHRPDALALSVTVAHNLPGLRAAVAAARARFPALPILAGGRAVAWAPGIGAELGIVVDGDSPEALIGVVEEALGGASGAWIDRLS